MHYRWRIVALLFLLSALNYVDRQTLSVLAPTLEKVFGYTSVQYSYVVAGFLLAYMLGNFFGGPMADRLGARRTIFLAVALWSTAGALHAFVTGWVTLLAVRFVLGLGESFNTPSALKVIAEWIPRRERGLSTAIVSNGYIAGAMLAPPLVSFIALRYSWRWAFLGTGLAGGVYLLLWLAHYNPPEKEPRLSPAELALILKERPAVAASRPRLSLLGALRNPLCLGLAGARLCTDSLSYFFTFWLPQYLHAERGFSLAMIGAWAWVPFLAADLGGPGGGAISDWLVRHGWRPTDARRRMLTCVACIMPLAAVAVRADSAAVAIALIAVILAAQSCWNSNLLTLITEYFPAERVATYAAATSFGGALGGIITTLLAGVIIHRFGFMPVFTGLGFLHLTALILLRISTERAKRIAPSELVEA